MRFLTGVQMAELLVFAALAVVSYVLWRRRRGRAALWLAVTFGILGIVVPVSWLPAAGGGHAGSEVIARGLAGLLALFPYALCRFAWSLSGPAPRVARVAAAGTAALVVAPFALPSVEAPSAGWTWWYTAYAVAFACQWTFLSLHSVVRLWRSGRSQPAVARRRIHTLSAAAILLNLALFFTVASGGRFSEVLALLTHSAGMLSALLFLVCFVPPRWLRTFWRRREVAAYRAAEAELMAADTTERVTAIMLPHAAALVGAEAAVLVEQDGSVRSAHRLEGEGAARVAGRLPVPSPSDAEPVVLDDLVAIPLRGGWLMVTTTPVTPVFGSEEIHLLSTLAHLAGLALDRAESFDRERKSRQALAEREYQLAEAQRTAQIGSYSWDLTTSEVAWSDEMYRLMGADPGDEVDKAGLFESRLHADDRARVLEEWRTAARNPLPTSSEFRVVVPDHGTRWIQARARPVVDEDGETVRLVGTLQDLTDRKAAEQAIAFQATHDALTRLPNRTLFMDRLGHALALRSRRPSGLAVLFLDVDRFKWLNDSLGHSAGDEVLLAVATRLRGALRPSDTLARFGGDEFVVLCENVASETEAEAVAMRLRTTLGSPIPVANDETTLTISVGIAYASPTATDVTAESLVRDADAAMYYAKEHGRDRHALFDLRTRQLALARHETANALRRGTDRGELVVHYQPQIDITSGRVVGVEALVRWNHPERGLLPPAEFIALAEETGIIVPLGARVLADSCRQVMAWYGRDGVPPGLSLSVNLAARQLLASDLTAVVSDALERSGLDPRQLCLEITESVLLDDGEGSGRAMLDLKELGVRIGVDDFGTVFSGLTYLKRFPVDVLKIDRSFVVGLGRDREDRAIVASVVDLAHAFGLMTVAEGVEVHDQLAELRALGCERGQGYLWSRPLPSEAAADWIAAHSLRLASGGPEPSRAPRAAGHPLRVLLVDDDPSLRRLFRLYFDEEPAFEVVAEAEDGRKAIAAARHFRPDVVVLDLAMPGIGGLEALPLIQAVAPDARIVVLSGLEPDSFAATAMRQGAFAYLPKGTGPEQIVRSLDALLAPATG